MGNDLYTLSGSQIFIRTSLGGCDRVDVNFHRKRKKGHTKGHLLHDLVDSCTFTSYHIQHARNNQLKQESFPNRDKKITNRSE